MTKSLKLALIYCFLIAFFAATPAYAVFVTPTIVTLDGNETTARITLNNRSPFTKVITLGWERRVLDDSGKVVLLEEGTTHPRYNPADPYIQYSPRRVILKPQQRQVIRLIVRKPQDLPEGEYRSHFLIQEENLIDQELAQKTNKGVSGQVVVNIGKSIPVLLRHGQTAAEASFNSASFGTDEKGRKVLNYSVSFNGTRSIYAYVRLRCQIDGEIKDFPVAPLRLYKERTLFEGRGIIKDDVPFDRCQSPIADIVVRDDKLLGGKTLDSHTF